MTPLRPDNCWKRCFRPHLEKAGLGWLNFLVMRRTHATLMKVLGVDGKLVADQLVVKSPANGLVMPHCKDAAPKRTITADDVLRAQMVLPLRERLIFRLAVCEGVRPGEIVALQVGDLRDGIFYVNRRVYSGKIDTPKSERSRRVVPATATTLALIEQWRELLPN